MTEQEAMRRALELAVRGWGRVAPNPMVGAVLLRDGQVVGEGYHAEFGGPHAEIEALAASPDAAGTTCVVNLEPCSHHGKTPPCSEALIEAGVSRVVTAIRDPHWDAGGGLDHLRDAGIDVVVGPSQDEAAALNAPFLFAARHPERPYVALKLATSLDGFLAEESGNSRWISGSAARDYVHWLRAGYGAIAVGRRTAETDDPRLTVRGAIEPRVPPTRVVFSQKGEFARDLKLFDTSDAPTTVVVGPSRSGKASELIANQEVTVLEADDLEAALGGLRRSGIQSLLIEGGGRLATSLLDRDLVDRLYWIQAPIWLGRGVPAFGSRPAIPLSGTEPWAVTERRGLGSDTLLVVDRGLCLQGS